MSRTDTNNRNERSYLDPLIDGLERQGDHPLLLLFTAEEPQRWTYAQMGQQVQALACGLQERIGPGETVALLGAEGPEWIITALAVIRAGAVVTPLDAQLADDTLKHVLEDSGAHWVFTSTVHQERVRNAAADAQIVLLDDEENEDWARLADGENRALPDNPADATAALFYTSGTTGPPKGVPLTHRNLSFQLETLARAGVAQAGDRVLLPLPLHHVYPFVVGMLTPLSLDLTLVMPHALTGPQVLRAVRDGRVSVIIGVPRFYSALYDGIVARAARAGRIARTVFKGALGLSRMVRRRLGLRLGKWLLYPLHRKVGRQLRLLACGGSALDPELAWNLEALGWQVTVGYGLTETSPLLTIDTPGKAHPGTVGKAVNGVELRIDRQSAEEKKASGDDGEVLARGPSIFQGYHDLPEKTDEAFTDDGWFRTGDLGWLDDQGYLHISGRVKTLIVTAGGENIQPDDLEERYASHPAIGEIGILQHDGDLVALVMPDRQIAEAPQDRIREAIAEVGRRLPSYQRLGDFALTRKPLPRTRLGKIKRHQLEERYEQALTEGAEPRRDAPLPAEEMNAEDRTLLEQPAARKGWEWLAERYPKQGLTPDTHLQLELGVDSLEWLDMTMELGQHTGVELDDEAIGRIETARDLLRELVDSAHQGEQLADPLEEPDRVLDDLHRRWLKSRGPVLRLAASALYGVNWMLIRGLFRLKVHDRHRLPLHGPVVLIGNHASYLDPFVVAAALPLARLHTLYWGGWTGVAFTSPLTRFVSRVAQVIPIDPKRGVRTSLALAATVLESEHGLIWFPEGQRSPDGELQAFRPGIGRLLERYPVPVTLASIHCTHEAMPLGRHLPRLRSLSIRFGEVLDPARLESEGQGDTAADRIVDALERHLRKLHEQ